MVSIPPHTSHRLQPLDVVFYGPFKRENRPGEPITIYNVAELFNKTYSRVATISKGVSGFSTTGIYIINPNVFSDEDFPLDAGDEWPLVENLHSLIADRRELPVEQYVSN